MTFNKYELNSLSNKELDSHFFVYLGLQVELYPYKRLLSYERSN